MQPKDMYLTKYNKIPDKLKPLLDSNDETCHLLVYHRREDYNITLEDIIYHMVFISKTWDLNHQWGRIFKRKIFNTEFYCHMYDISNPKINCIKIFNTTAGGLIIDKYALNFRSNSTNNESPEVKIKKCIEKIIKLLNLE